MTRPADPFIIPTGGMRIARVGPDDRRQTSSGEPPATTGNDTDANATPGLRRNRGHSARTEFPFRLPFNMHGAFFIGAAEHRNGCPK